MKLAIQAVIIANGASLSGEIDLTPQALRAIVFPSSWTAADIAFQCKPNASGTYGPVLDWDGTVWATSAAAASTVIVRPELGESLTITKLRSVNTADATAAVNQGAERTIYLITEG